MSLEAVDGTVPSFSGQVLHFCASFMFRKFPAVLRRVAVPLLIGAMALFVWLSVYFSELYAYLQNPAGSIASRVLGVAAAGILVMLFLHSIVVASVTEIVLGYKIPGARFLGIHQWQWRLYVANLRLLLAMVASAGLFWLIHVSVANSSVAVEFSIDAVAAGFMFWFFVRIWFFLLPVCVDTTEEQAVLKSWRMSAGHFFRATITLLPLFLLILVFQGGGEILFRVIHVIAQIRTGNSFSSNVLLLRDNLLPIVVLMTANYLWAVMLTTAARIETYRCLKGDFRIFDKPVQKNRWKALPS